ncbi:tetratricopeptide repeat protein [Balneola sp. MJW-20]|uniref:tetratricopeptide repeat protein n=1 Tax=Gracilimonas aurantiaca TaxID=3234185 RepID=UPI003467435A
MNTIRLVVFGIILLTFNACTEGSQQTDPTDTSWQAVSLLGDTLYTPESSLNETLSVRLDSLINSAENNNDPATALVWKARRLGYQGDYRSAIDLLSDGIELYPEEARLYRHRGHRYISVREFNLAIADLEKAAGLVEGTEDIVEPDGLPNAQNIPLSTLQTNIWYHLGLAYFLNGNYADAESSYQNGLDLVQNDDMKVAFLYWQYITFRKHGNDLKAGQVLGQVHTDLNIIENRSYYDLLRVFKGEFDEESLLDASETALDNATVGYGLGFWHDINGRQSRANEIWSRIYNSGPWAAFGYIASESELARAK